MMAVVAFKMQGTCELFTPVKIHGGLTRDK